MLKFSLLPCRTPCHKLKHTPTHPAPQGSAPSPAGLRLILMGLPWWKSPNNENNEISKDPKKGYCSSCRQHPQPRLHTPPIPQSRQKTTEGRRRGDRGGSQTDPGGRKVKDCERKKTQEKQKQKKKERQRHEGEGEIRQRQSKRSLVHFRAQITYF